MVNKRGLRERLLKRLEEVDDPARRRRIRESIEEIDEELGENQEKPQKTKKSNGDRIPSTVPERFKTQAQKKFDKPFRERVRDKFLRTKEQDIEGEAEKLEIQEERRIASRRRKLKEAREGKKPTGLIDQLGGGLKTIARNTAAEIGAAPRANVRQDQGGSIRTDGLFENLVGGGGGGAARQGAGDEGQFFDSLTGAGRKRKKKTTKGKKKRSRKNGSGLDMMDFL